MCLRVLVLLLAAGSVGGAVIELTSSGTFATAGRFGDDCCDRVLFLRRQAMLSVTRIHTQIWTRAWRKAPGFLNFTRLGVGIANDWNLFTMRLRSCWRTKSLAFT